MEVKPIHLSDEELNFELELRGVAGLGPMTNRIKCSRLEKVMQDDLRNGRVYSSSAHVVDSSSEIRTGQSRVNRLMPQINTGIERKNVAFLEPIVSRLNHYYNRLTLASPQSEDMQEEWKSTREVIARTQRQIFHVFNHVNQKLNPKFVPAIVKAVLGHNLYELEDISSGKRGRYHAKDLKSD